MLVRIMTHCTWTSLGSMLQSFGLKKALQSENIQSQILLPADTNAFRSVPIRSAKSLAQALFAQCIRANRREAYQKRICFLRNNLDLREYGSYQELTQLCQADDVRYYLAGSDQIWNPDRCEPAFFLEFARNKSRISYAASMGKTQLTPEAEKTFRSLLKNFDHISVRERHCADIIGPLADRPVHIHIDPVFLLPAEQWREYALPYDIEGPYILLYMLYWDASCRSQLQTLKQQTSLPVYAISGGLSRVCADRHLYNVGVEEFLWLVDHAAYVVTSSFHGAAFSVIFNKPFSPVINPNLPSRIDHLLTCLDIPRIEIAQLGSAEPLPYPQINQRIAQERQRGLAYLKQVLHP